MLGVRVPALLHKKGRVQMKKKIEATKEMLEEREKVINDLLDRKVKLDKKTINFINFTFSSEDKESENKKIVLKQMRLWHKLSKEEREKIEKDSFLSDIARDNYTQRLIMKYL